MSLLRSQENADNADNAEKLDLRHEQAGLKTSQVIYECLSHKS